MHLSLLHQCDVSREKYNRKLLKRVQDWNRYKITKLLDEDDKANVEVGTSFVI